MVSAQFALVVQLSQLAPVVPVVPVVPVGGQTQSSVLVSHVVIGPHSEGAWLHGSNESQKPAGLQ